MRLSCAVLRVIFLTRPLWIVASLHYFARLASIIPTGKAFSVTGMVREARDLGFDLSCHSRGLVEYCVRRHYERLTAFPEGFVALGDAISSFNPFYGQGMSSAALQVQALQQLLTE